MNQMPYHNTDIYNDPSMLDNARYDGIIEPDSDNTYTQSQKSSIYNPMNLISSFGQSRK